MTSAFNLKRIIPAATAQDTMASASQGTRVSIFGIIIVGLIAGLIVGLLAGPAYTFQGFFLGFAGGSLIIVAIYFITIQRSHPAR